MDADLHLGDTFRLFTEFQSGLEYGHKGGPRPSIDENVANLHQAYLDINFPSFAEGSFTLRLGRQELAYGIGRLIDMREGPNVRQSFDGIKGILHVEKWEIDEFATRLVENNTDRFDNPVPSPNSGASTARARSIFCPDRPLTSITSAFGVTSLLTTVVWILRRATPWEHAFTARRATLTMMWKEVTSSALSAPEASTPGTSRTKRAGPSPRRSGSLTSLLRSMPRVASESQFVESSNLRHPFSSRRLLHRTNSDRRAERHRRSSRGGLASDQGSLPRTQAQLLLAREYA